MNRLVLMVVEIVKIVNQILINMISHHGQWRRGVLRRRERVIHVRSHDVVAGRRRRRGSIMWWEHGCLGSPRSRVRDDGRVAISEWVNLRLVRQVQPIVFAWIWALKGMNRQRWRSGGSRRRGCVAVVIRVTRGIVVVILLWCEVEWSKSGDHAGIIMIMLSKVRCRIIFKQWVKHFVNVELCGKCLGTCKCDPKGQFVLECGFSAEGRGRVTLTKRPWDAWRQLSQLLGLSHFSGSHPFCRGKYQQHWGV